MRSLSWALPVLGICFGMYAMAEALGGKVEGGHKREFGYAEMRARGHTKLLEGIADYTTTPKATACCMCG
jgi:GMP synthase (glutamine-hydrolysing)